jgi:hypothetical protein
LYVRAIESVEGVGRKIGNEKDYFPHRRVGRHKSNNTLLKQVLGLKHFRCGNHIQDYLSQVIFLYYEQTVLLVPNFKKPLSEGICYLQSKQVILNILKNQECCANFQLMKPTFHVSAVGG